MSVEPARKDTPENPLVHVAVMAIPELAVSVLMNRFLDHSGDFIASQQIAVQQQKSALELPGAPRTPNVQFQIMHVFRIPLFELETWIGGYDERKLYPAELFLK